MGRRKTIDMGGGGGDLEECFSHFGWQFLIALGQAFCDFLSE